MSRLSTHYSKLTPEAFQKLLDLSYSLHGSSLGVPLLELVKLRISQVNGCAYCIDMHTRALLEGGEDTQRLALLPAWRECEAFFSPEERAALAWAEGANAFAPEAEMDAAFAELSKHFGEKEIAELSFAVAVLNTWNIMNVSLRNPVAKKPMPEAKLRKAS